MTSALSNGQPLTSSIFGSSSADLASCLHGLADPACFFGSRPHAQGIGAAAIAPGAPSGLSATVGGGTVTLTWNPPASGDPVTTYMIEAGSSAGASNLASIVTNSTATTFSAAGVGSGTYFVRVRAQNAGGSSGSSNELMLIIGSGGSTSAPNAPSGLVTSASGSTVTLTWTAPVAGCAPTSYILQAGSAPGLSDLANSNTGTTATSYVAPGVGAGTYYVRIRAANAYGQSAPSNESTLVVGSGPVPSVAGTWSLTRTGDSRYPWIATYSSFTVTFAQSGSTLTGTILPVGQSRTSPILFGQVSSGGGVYFGTESFYAYWNDLSDGYFSLSLDSTLNRMSGTCNRVYTCTSATAVRIR